MIKVLDKATIDKIAAGEVIERPSSVVKELLENAIDAGASAITVEIKEGGTSFIRVTDNGCGIAKDEVRTAYMRHATSKIEQVEDLNSILSLGFRGEALSTIAAVSQTEMITKTAMDLTGIKYVIHGGKEIEYKEVGVPNGTTIVVRNLFFNTPARKKFLKSAMTEGSYIFDLLTRIALSHPEISFKMIVNGQTKLDTAGNGKLKDTIYQLYGRDITANLIEVDYTDDDIHLSGFIGKPFIARGNRGLENYFINHRYIKSHIVNRAIEEGYRTFVMQHKFPFTVLYLDLPQEKCDVNVHPTKMEFKYDNEKKLFEVCCTAIRQALTHKEIIPKAEEKTTAKPVIENPTQKPAEPFETKRAAQTNRAVLAYANQTQANRKAEAAPSASATTNPQTENVQAANPQAENVQVTKTQIANVQATKPQAANPQATSIQARPQANAHVKGYSPTYKILESLRKAEEQEAQKNGTALPNLADLVADDGVIYTPNEPEKSKPADAITIGQQQSLFDDDFLTEKARLKHRIIGQVFETYWLIEYNENLYIIDQHAAHEKVKYEELLENLHTKKIFSQQLMPPMVVTVTYAERQAILDNYDLFMKIGYDIEEFGGNEFKINAVPSNLFGLHGRDMFMEFVGSLIQNSGYMSNDVFIKKLSTMACKAAVKGNMRLSIQEMDALIDKLLSLENPYTCPHGRPTIISMSKTELEKKFHRIVS